MTGGVCWVLSNGRAGTVNQCLGLAEAVGFSITVKEVRPRALWRWLPPRLWPWALRSLGPESDPIEEPWPDLVIACGRSTEAIAVAIRRAAAKEDQTTFTVYLQRPSHNTEQFDLLAPPLHDQVTGSNVIATLGALHRVTPELLAADAEKFAALVAPLPRPLIAVLVGGTGNAYRMTETAARNLGQQLAALSRDQDMGLAITVSRRTGVKNTAALRAELADIPSVIWDDEGDNPYFGFLGLADAIIVTADSISMVSEACATGKPVYVAEIPGGSAKFERFHEGLRSKGLTRRFAGDIELWSASPLDDTARVAAAVRERLASIAAPR